MGIKQASAYPSDVTDEEWCFVLPYLLLCREDIPQRKHDLRTVFNAVRYVARTGGQWRYLPNDLPPWFVVYQQMQRWLRAGCLEVLVEDVRSLLREWGGRKSQPTAVVIDSRTLQSTPESGARAGYDGAKRRKGSKVHIAVDTNRTMVDTQIPGPLAKSKTRSASSPLEDESHGNGKQAKTNLSSKSRGTLTRQWAGSRDKNLLGVRSRGNFSLDIPFYRTH